MQNKCFNDLKATSNDRQKIKTQEESDIVLQMQKLPSGTKHNKAIVAKIFKTHHSLYNFII